MPRPWPVLVALVIASPLAAAPVPKEARGQSTRPNSNALVIEFKEKLTADASSEYQGYPVAKLLDGDPLTPWYSTGQDAPMNGKQPWVRVTFPQDVLVRRVTVLGNRDPQYPNGYSVLSGKLELLDAKGKVLAAREMTATGDKFDFDWLVTRPPANTRAVRFTATKDQGQYNCVGLAEVEIE